ncbi:MAG: hypothetical protein AABY50_03160 [Nitrospirota bacterium]
MAKSIQYDQSFIDKLLERTEYELWFLEEVYDIAGKPLFPIWPDNPIYFLSEKKPLFATYCSGNITLFDWRTSFLTVGSPLIFVMAFKILDMFVDLVLEKNGVRQSHRFQEKIAKLKDGVVFPDFIHSRPWLEERFVGLYETLVPLRGTIIHDRHFGNTGGILKVSSSKKGVIGPEFKIEGEQLHALVLLVISIIRYVEGSWKINAYKEKFLRRAFDDLQIFHGCSLMGQLPPTFDTVRMYVMESGSISIDLGAIRKDLEQRYQGQDIIFDLRIIVVSNDRRPLAAYLIPWSEIEREGNELVTQSQLAKYVSSIPDDFRPDKIFQELKNG